MSESKGSSDSPPTPRSWRRIRLVARVGSVGCIAASLLLPSTWIEAGFSDGLFPITQRWLVPLTGSMPFPIMGLVLLIAPIVLVVWAFRGWRRARALEVTVTRRLLAGCGHGLRLILYVYVAFLLAWGFGYRRVPVEERWGIEDRPARLSEVAKLRARLVTLIWRDCVPDSERDRDRARTSIQAAQAKLVEELEGFRPAWPAHVKSLPTGILMTIDVGGVVSPWTLEAHVEAALPDPQWLATCGHELAHLAGYCGEADANLVGFMSGLRADDPFARYSTALRLFRYTNSKQDYKGYLEAYLALPARARQDMRSGQKVRDKFVVKRLKAVSTKIYDKYLRSQGMKSGMGDYSRGFRLFVRAWAKGLVPPLPR